MKGIVFTQFVEFVEDQFGLQTADQMIASSSLESGGAFTSVGTYPHQEMARMITQLSRITDTSQADLLRQFGKTLFHYLVSAYPEMLAQTRGAFDLLTRIDNHIHVEVLKLYPDAELPKFQYTLAADGEMQLLYSSTRGLADLAEGLLMGCFEHYGEQVEITRENLSASACTNVRFRLRKVPSP